MAFLGKDYLILEQTKKQALDKAQAEYLAKIETKRQHMLTDANQEASVLLTMIGRYVEKITFKDSVNEVTKYIHFTWDGNNYKPSCWDNDPQLIFTDYVFESAINKREKFIKELENKKFIQINGKMTNTNAVITYEYYNERY